MQQQGGAGHFVERRPERGHQLFGQIGDEADGIRENHIDARDQPRFAQRRV